MEAIGYIICLVLALRPTWTLAWQKGHAQLKTEPSFTPLIVNVTTNKDPAALAPGYIFLTPMGNQQEGFYEGYGMHMFDNDGELVWYGNDSADYRALRGHVCDYLGERNSKLCWHDGPRIHKTFNYGAIRFFDETYTQVGEDHTAVANLDEPDGHQIHTVDNGNNLLQDVFQIRYMSEGKNKGYAYDCCFQDIDLNTGEEIFQWCTADHLPICGVSPAVKGAKCWKRMWPLNKGTKRLSWDVWHMNYIDKNFEGDYLVSVRHLDTVLKVAGVENVHGVEPGTVLWSLNGEHSEIKQKNFNFSRQHVARFVNTTSTTTTFTLLNNAYSGRKNEPSSAEWSSGMLIEVNNQTNTARELMNYPNPDHKLSNSAGNMHMLDNGNVFVGWGYLPSYSEYDQNGTLLYHAEFTHTSPQAWKYPWVGRPKTKPKMVAYTLECASEYPVYAYASWNGATELKFWEIYGSNRSEEGPWKLAGSANKTSFETRIELESFALYFYAKAYDTDRIVLAESEIAKLFVPNKTQSHDCDESGCNEPQRFTYDAIWSYTEKCTRVGPFRPSEPVGLPEPVENGDPVQSALPVEPTETAEPSKSNKPFGPAKPIEPSHTWLTGLVVLFGLAEVANWIMVDIFWPSKFGLFGHAAHSRPAYDRSFALR